MLGIVARKLFSRAESKRKVHDYEGLLMLWYICSAIIGIFSDNTITHFKIQQCSQSGWFFGRQAFGQTFHRVLFSATTKWIKKLKRICSKKQKKVLNYPKLQSYWAPFFVELEILWFWDNFCKCMNHDWLSSLWPNSKHI